MRTLHFSLASQEKNDNVVNNTIARRARLSALCPSLHLHKAKHYHSRHVLRAGPAEAGGGHRPHTLHPRDGTAPPDDGHVSCYYHCCVVVALSKPASACEKPKRPMLNMFAIVASRKDILLTRKSRRVAYFFCPFICFPPSLSLMILYIV